MDLYSQVVQRCALPWVSLTTRSSFWSRYRELRDRRLRLQQPTPDELCDHLRKLLIHAHAHVPFYRERMNALGFNPSAVRSLDDLHRLPPTTKADVAANFPDRLTSTVRMHVPWRMVATSGTIDRISVIHDFRKRDVVRVAQLLGLRMSTGYEPGMRYLEIPPDVCTNVCGVAGTVEPPLLTYLFQSARAGDLFDAEVISNVRGLIERQVIYRRLELPGFNGDGTAQTPDALNDYLDRIARHRPYVMKALPIYLYLLAVHILDNKLASPPISGGIMPMGSAMTRYMKEVVTKAFGCPVHEDYGSAEMGVFAAECRHQSGLHAFGDLFHLEVLRGDRPAECGEAGRVLVTDLFNYAMPLIRYEIGDIASLTSERCRCGLDGDRLTVHGRIQDCLVSDDGELVTPGVVTDALLRRPDVLAFQLDQRTPGELDLQIVPRGAQAPDVAGAAETVRAIVGPKRRIRGRRVSTILPERGGKYRFVRNSTPAPWELLKGVAPC
jgi:phenylacetate-CoA ligase